MFYLIDYGLIYTVKAMTAADLNRQIVKSRYCTVTVPEIELTIPPGRGQLTTIEGLLRAVVDDLSPEQPLRRIQNPQAYEKIQSIIDKLNEFLPEQDSDQSTPRPIPPFTVKVEDPSGNSFVEFIESMSDPQWNMREFQRTTEDNVLVGLLSPDDAAEQEKVKRVDVQPEALDPDEIFIFPGICSSCAQPLDTKMKRVDIPYFKARLPTSLLINYL